MKLGGRNWRLVTWQSVGGGCQISNYQPLIPITTGGSIVWLV